MDLEDVLGSLFTGICVLVVGGFFIFLFWLLFISSKIPLHNDGEHVGYVTAVERRGIFYHNYSIYVKTDNSSSQEDTYCVEEGHEGLLSQIRELNLKHKHVVIRYTENFTTGLFNAYCGDEILSVAEVK